MLGRENGLNRQLRQLCRVYVLFRPPIVSKLNNYLSIVSGARMREGVQMRRFNKKPILTIFLTTVMAMSSLVFMAGPANALVAHKADASQNNVAGATTLVITTPAGATTGDLLLAQITVESGSDVVITPPSGWTSVIRTDNSNSIGQEIFWKAATGAEPANYTFTFSQSTRASGGVLAYTGANMSNPIDVSGGNTGNTNPLTAPSVTTTSDNGLLMTFFGVKQDSGIGHRLE